MPRKFRRYVPKGATRQNSSTAPSSSSTPAISDEDSANHTTCTIGTQCELQLTSTEDEAVQVVAETVDASTQTDELICTDELQDEVQPIQNDRICEGNNDIKFHPLVIKHNGIFINLKGVYILCVICITLY